jgi:predicted metalloprotease with PDZ domain
MSKAAITSRMCASLLLLLASPPVVDAAGLGLAGEGRALGEVLHDAVLGATGKRDAFVYQVAMPDPHRHEFHLSLEFTGLAGDRAALELPKWNPGAYRLTNAHRNVRAVVARSLGDGELLPVSKLDENTWEVEHGGKPFALDYRVYCGRYTGIAGCYLDDAMGFFNGVHLFMYAVGHKHQAIELRVREPIGGKQAEVVTGLPAHGSTRARSKPTTFWANNYDTLVDSPVHVGVVDTIDFELGGRPIRAVMSDRGGWKADEIRDELRAITQAGAAVFGPLETALPFTDYTFIYHVLPDAGGGLEHHNSTVIGVDPWGFASAAGKRRFWSVTAHEFFHLWNVKRIRPAVLGPFDYDRQVHTTMLWFSEGFTSYYAILILSRAGLIDEAQARKDLAARLAAVETRPGRTLMSVEQSSWETWATPDDGANAYFSYYDKGAMIGMILDLQLRATSQGLASTDTLFRALWQRWRETGLGLTPQELEDAFVEQVAKYGDAAVDEIRAIFADYVRGVVELDYDKYLAHAGYRLQRSVKAEGPWIGVELSGARVRNVLHDAPGDRAGLANGDELVAINGRAVDGSSYARVLESLTVDTPHEFTITRMGRVIDLKVTPVLGGDPVFELVELDDVSAQQRQLRRDWLGLP